MDQSNETMQLVEDDAARRRRQCLAKHSPPNPTPLAQPEARGIAIVLLDALARREWAREEELAATLRLHPGVARRALRYLEQAS